MEGTSMPAGWQPDEDGPRRANDDQGAADSGAPPDGGAPGSGSGGRSGAEAPPRPWPRYPEGQWEAASHALTAATTGSCLARRDARGAGQGPCGSHGRRRHDAGGGTHLLKHVGADRCLDTDETKLYPSDCTTEDTGQVWRLTAAASPSSACRS